MRHARGAKRLEAGAGTERLAETRWLSKPLACGYEVHADARKPRRQPGGPPEKGTATALCPRRLLKVSLVLFDCSACPLRCRGGLNGGGGQEGFGIWRASASAAKNRIPPPSAVADCGVLLPSAPSSSVFDLRTSAHPSFLLSPPLNMYWVGWGGAQAFPRERITRVGLFAR